MRYAIQQAGESRSIPAGDAFLAHAVAPEAAEVMIHLGTPLRADDARAAILVEPGAECLGVEGRLRLGAGRLGSVCHVRLEGDPLPRKIVEPAAEEPNSGLVAPEARGSVGASEHHVGQVETVRLLNLDRSA